MSVTIRQIHPVFVGEVAGVDLRKPLTADEAATIEAGMDRYAVLVFHDQNITDQQQLAFSRNFGEIERAVGGHIMKDNERRLSFDMADISNLDKDNKVLARDDRRRMFNLGNELWHSDSSYRAIPAKFSLLSARISANSVSPPVDGIARAAYDALDARTKGEIEDLITEHSLMYSRGTLGFTDFTEEERKTFAPVRQRLVRTHPASRRKSLYLASHAGTIVGWPMPEARAFLRDLTEHATQRQFVHAHHWRQYDLVIWDNRATMHRARRYDYTQVRDMRRTTLAGSEPTAEQVRAA
jgi:alpha-ketoglutarate-dependent 2,4-dichlorophenoxyacetate dioxygenase